MAEAGQSGPEDLYTLYIVSVLCSILCFQKITFLRTCSLTRTESLVLYNTHEFSHDEHTHIHINKFTYLASHKQLQKPYHLVQDQTLLHL